MRTNRRRPGRAARPSGLITVLLVIAPVAAAMIISYRYRLSVPESLISALLGGGALASVYQGWASSRSAGHHSGDPKLGQLADNLAIFMKDQWEAELAVRQRHDHVQLSVSWVAAKPSLTYDWERLVLMAGGAGWPAPPPPGTWADGPDVLAGSGFGLTEVFGRVPTGRLVVLGEAGAGKTMLMVRLLLDLLARRREGGPVPVLVALGSWNPREVSLREFIEERLILDQPALAGSVVHAGKELTQIRALLNQRMIVPILDGLDEIGPDFRQAAINKINHFLSMPGPLLITSRVSEYQEAIGQPGPDWDPPHGAAAVELQPLGVEAVKKYLADPGRAERWAPVLAALSEPAAVSEALRTPLFVTLARAIYNPRRGERTGQVPDPAELCDEALFPTSADIKDHLFDAFIAAAYRPDRGDDAEVERWGAAQAQTWLTYLARFLDREPAGQRQDDQQQDAETTKDLKWWALRDAAPRALVPGVVGTVCGIIAGIPAALGSHVGIGIGVGFGTGLLIALAIGLSIRRLTNFAGTRPGGGMAGALIGAAVGGVAAGLAGKLGIGHEASLFSGLPEALGIGIGGGASTRFAGGLAGGLVGGFVGGLLEGVGLGLPAGLVDGLGVGLAAGLAVAYVGRREPARQRPEWIREVGIPGGLVIGLVVGLITWREKGLIAGLVLAAVIGGLSSWPFGLRDTNQELEVVPSPGNALARDARAFRRTSIAAGVAAAVAGFFGGSLSSIFEVGAKVSLRTVLGDGLGIGLSSGLIIGLAFGFYHAASPAFMISSWWLAIRRRLPWRIMLFLNEVHQKSILRQNGAVYQFRHEKFRVHLARAQRPERRSPADGEPGPDGPQFEPGQIGSARQAVTEPAS
jgi:hypothetical protein